MGCPSRVYIGDNLVFSICTHDPDTGVLTDADAVPAYRVYEDETATAILTGNMAVLDDVNTIGFYTESIACTAGNGFENGKTYTVYITATVDGDTGGICYSFKAETPLTATGLATTGADSDTLETLSDQLDGTASSAALAAAYAIANSGLGFRGAVSAVPGANQFTIPTLAGLGAGIFTDVTAPYYAFVLRDAGGLSAAPQGETQTVTAYNTATGTFTTAAFTVPVGANDDIIIMHPRLAELAAIRAQTDQMVFTGGRIDASVGAVANGAITAAAIATGAIDADAIADNAIDAGAIASSAITAAKIATGAIDADALATDAVTEIAGGVWTHTSRTLTQSATTVVSSATTTSISQVRGDVWDITLTDLADNTGYTHIDFTVKNSMGDADSAAILHIRKDATPAVPAIDGLITLNGAASGDLAAGYITVNSSTSLTFHVDGDKTAQIAISEGRDFDVQYFFTDITDSPVTATSGTFVVTADVTRRTD